MVRFHTTVSYAQGPLMARLRYGGGGGPALCFRVRSFGAERRVAANQLLVSVTGLSSQGHGLCERIENRRCEPLIQAPANALWSFDVLKQSQSTNTSQKFKSCARL